MNNRWGKGEPVNLSDLLKITPVANEILQLSEELNMSRADLMWIVSQIIDNQDNNKPFSKMDGFEDEEDISIEDEWDEIDSVEEDMGRAMYMVNVKVNSTGRFPEIGFKAGVTDKEDISYFFEMIMEMLEKLE